MFVLAVIVLLCYVVVQKSQVNQKVLCLDPESSCRSPSSSSRILFSPELTIWMWYVVMLLLFRAMVVDENVETLFIIIVSSRLHTRTFFSYSYHSHFDELSWEKVFHQFKNKNYVSFFYVFVSHHHHASPSLSFHIIRCSRFSWLRQILNLELTVVTHNQTITLHLMENSETWKKAWRHYNIVTRTRVRKWKILKASCYWFVNIGCDVMSQCNTSISQPFWRV